MATKTFEELKQLAIQIRDEKTNKRNTATRVGTAMLEHINKLEQDYYDKTKTDKELKERDDKLTELSNGQGIYNLDSNVPLSSGQFYTADTARAAVPESVRKLNLIITYKTDAATSVTEQFTGSDISAWATDSNWKNVGSEGSNKILVWKTDVATTRKQVAVNERKAGMQISYKPEGLDWVNEQYIGTDLDDKSWVSDSNWKPMSQKIEVDKVLDEESEKPIANSAATRGINEVKEQLSTQLPAIEQAKESAIKSIGDKESEAIQNFSDQRVTPGMLSPETMQIINASGGGTINNLPDGETLAEIELAEGIKAIGIPNRKAETNLGYVILKKNKSLIEQIKDANTIYEVRYAYDLGGETLPMPENCVLKFEGGIISNGIINGNKTSIVAPIYKIFGDNLNFSEDAGSFYIDCVYAEWWGCVGRFPKKADITPTYPQDAPYSSESKALPDCAPYFNKAFEFAHRYSCAVKALGCCYAVRSTIKILENTTFITEENTVFCVYMKGTGKTIVTQSTETSEFSSEEVDEVPCYLKQNQYIDTSSMAVAFEVSSCRVKLLGRGTISLGYTQYCIGMLVKSRDYETLDMSYFLEIDLRFVGGIYGEQAGDSKDLYGYGKPTDDSLNKTGESQYYIDLSSVDSNPDYKGLRLQRYEKKNNTNTWSANGQYWRRMSTDLRFEMSQGGAGGRLIDPHIRIGSMFGFRGVEIITHDGGWFNISTWEGTISNKYGNYLSIFSDYDANSHNFSGLTMQWGYSNWETCVFYAIRTSGITIGASADLAYAKPKIEFGFYFGKYTSNCVQTWIDDISYVVDLGTNNNVGYNIMLENQTLAGTCWVNQWSKKLPTNLGFMKIDSVKTVDEIESVIDDVDNFTIEDYYPVLFDDDDSTYETVIDTDNGIFGTYFLVDKNNAQRGMSKEWAYIEIDFCVVGNNANRYENGVFNIMLFNTGYIAGNSGTHLLKPIIRETTYFSSYTAYVQRMFIPVKKNVLSRGRLAIFTTKLQEKIQLQIYGIKLWTTNFAPAEIYQYRNIYPQNSYLNSEEGTIFYNAGNSNNNDFRKIGLENRMLEDVIVPVCLKGAFKVGFTINAYSTKTATYEIIDPKGMITAKMDNNVEGNTGIFPGGYQSGYRGLNFTYNGEEDLNENPYFFKVKFKGIVGLNVSGYCLTNLIDILQAGVKELTFSNHSSQSGLLTLNGEDISNYVSDLRYFNAKLTMGFNTVSDSAKALISTASMKNIEYFNASSVFEVYGNLSLLPRRLYTFYTNGGDELTYNTVPHAKVWGENFANLYIEKATSFTSEMIDALLIDLAESIKSPEGTTKQIKLLKTAGERTSASDSAVEILENLGFTISITQ